MADLEKGLVEVSFSFQVKCGPNVPIVEISRCEDKITVTDLAPNLTSQEFGLMTASMCGVHFLETYLAALGHERYPSGFGLAKKRVKIIIEDR